MPQMAMHAATTFQEGNVEGAMVTFQQASGILYEIARYTPIQTGAGKDDPTKAIDLRGMEFFTPLTGGAVPGGPKYWEEAFFRYPLMPCEAANYQSHLPDTASQIAAWVVSTMFNTAVCHHIAGTTSRIEQAIQLYKDTWAVYSMSIRRRPIREFAHDPYGRLSQSERLLCTHGSIG